MSSDSTFSLGRICALLFMIMTTGLIAGCQVRPLYAEGGEADAKLASVIFSEPRNRVEQTVRNHLIFLTSGGRGEAVKADYSVKLAVTSTSTNILDKRTREGPAPGRVVVTGNYELVRISDGVVLRSAERRVASTVGLPAQEFAAIRAIRDAEDRAARELAEFIRADISTALVR